MSSFHLSMYFVYQSCICNAPIMSCFLVCNLLCSDVYDLHSQYFMNPYKILCIPKFSVHVKFSGHKILLWRDVENFVSFCRPACSKRFRSTPTVIKILSRNELCSTNFVCILDHSDAFSDVNSKRFGYNMV
jgi:hypothetical protein